jgi:hypothetical protein
VLCPGIVALSGLKLRLARRQSLALNSTTTNTKYLPGQLGFVICNDTTPRLLAHWQFQQWTRPDAPRGQLARANLYNRHITPPPPRTHPVAQIELRDLTRRPDHRENPLPRAHCPQNLRKTQSRPPPSKTQPRHAESAVEPTSERNPQNPKQFKSKQRMALKRLERTMRPFAASADSTNTPAHHNSATKTTNMALGKELKNP